MAEALISVLLGQLASVVYQHTKMLKVLNADKDVKSFSSKLKAIQAVLEDAEKKQVTEARVGDWLQKLKDVAYEMDDLLDEWNTELLRQQVEEKQEVEGDNALVTKKKVCIPMPSTCFCFGQVNKVIHHHNIARRIKELNDKLTLIAAEREIYGFHQSTIGGHDDQQLIQRQKTSSLVDRSTIFGREEEKEYLLSKLLRESNQDGGRVLVIPIVGMGGMGKTTLTQLVYNDEEVTIHFDKKAWVCVSNPFDEVKIARAVIENLDRTQRSTKELESNSNELETLLLWIRSRVENKKFLLVLDDVWTEDQKKWENLNLPEIMQSCKEGSTIVVTTRNQGVAEMMGATSSMILLDKLSHRDCLALFNSFAFLDREEDEANGFGAIGEEIAKKCKGLPLAAKTLGSLVWYKKTREEWQDVLNGKIWELGQVEEQVFRSLLLSYYDLAPAVKRCLLYCAIFPKDYNLRRDNLIELWMSQGYLNSKKRKEKRRIGQNYFESLAMRSFFQDFDKDEMGNIIGCKMDDIVHDFLQFLTQRECVIIEADAVEGANQRMELPGNKVRHLTLTSLPKGPLSTCYGCENMRSLTLLDSSITTISPSSILQMKCLRALNLSHNSLNELPQEIGELIHLRYMDLSYNEFLKELPDIVCDLYNLQTLVLVECRGLVRLPKAMEKLINLMHLNVGGCNKLRYPPTGIAFIASLKCLNVLNLSHNIINEVPKEIGELIHLIYLNLSYNEVLKELPKAVCDLYNLETLVLVGCRRLKKLPNAMGKLTSLKHLYVWDCDKLRYLPKGIGSLKSLQALDCFYVCDGDDEALKLGHLGIMYQLPGRLRINRLGNDAKDDASEIEKAQLGNKEHLSHLGVRFHEGYEEQRKGDEEIVKALQPHPNLKSLSIWNCHGTTKCLYWIRSLHNLREVNLEGWQFCEVLPPLGKLPSLEILEIQWVDNVKKVGDEFLGIEEETETLSGILFPKLKQLSFRFMPNWEEWEGIIKDSCEITIMPMLSSLQIWYCPELKALPDFLHKIKALRTLTIGYSSILERDYEKGVGKEWHNISHISNLTIGYSED